MAIIASAIFGRSAFTFGRIRIIRFISSEERCPLNMIYKHALTRKTYRRALIHASMGTVLNGNLDVLQTMVTALAKHKRARHAAADFPPHRG